jgi:hypothetical protein
MSEPPSIARFSLGTSMCLALVIGPKGRAIWTFPICGPKRPREHSPGFTLGNSRTRISPEGAARCGENRLRTFEPDPVRIRSPFRVKRLFWLTQGEPWAKLSCPFGADPTGHMTGAEQIRNPGLSTRPLRGRFPRVNPGLSSKRPRRVVTIYDAILASRK